MRQIRTGPVSFTLLEGDLRSIRLGGVEVLRRLSYPVRDPQWGTHAVETLSEELQEGAQGVTYTRRFAGRGAIFGGIFRAVVRPLPSGAHLLLSVEMDAPADLAVNRAGFTLLHPLRGVSGAALRVIHPDGSEEATEWPRLISPAQPVRDIAGLSHVVDGVTVDIRMRGDIFEMEDQRNWSDASYKTYCRPLAWPLPFALGPAAPVRQELDITLTGAPVAAVTGDAAHDGSLPHVAVAVEPGLTVAPVLAGLEALPRLLRVRADAAVEVLAGFATGGPVTLEVILPDGDDPAASLAALALRCAAAGLRPLRVVALRESYMKSHQPDGVWPKGPRPMDLIAGVRSAFPQAAAGGGMFTNFTEFNRCRPDPAQVDFVTWGGTAIVHAADDLSVMETLEALPQIFASGRAIARGRPLHLGLFSIGMRSNPYATDCLPNPAMERLAMVRDDPRQATGFAAAFAAGVLAGAAAGGVASLALSMTDGPLGAEGRPLAQVVAWAAARAGMACRVWGGDVVRIDTAKGTLLANIGGEAMALPDGARGRLIGENGPRDLGGVSLVPCGVAFLEGGGA